LSAARKPCIRELVGGAVNASHLTLDGRQERALDRVAALGAAALAVRLGADVEDVPIAAAKPLVYGSEPDVRDVLAGELVPILWHIRYGAQLDLVPKAVGLFAMWVGHRPAFAAYVGDEHLSLRTAFSERSLHEWLSDRCATCGGSKKQQRSSTGRWIKPLGSMQRNATFRPCVACSGSGRAPIRHPERMKALGLTRQQYEEQRWPQRFNAACTWLGELLPSRIVRALTAELERRKRR
jgi:hypothetical protein